MRDVKMKTDLTAQIPSVSLPYGDIVRLEFRNKHRICALPEGSLTSARVPFPVLVVAVN